MSELIEQLEKATASRVLLPAFPANWKLPPDKDYHIVAGMLEADEVKEERQVPYGWAVQPARYWSNRT